MCSVQSPTLLIFDSALFLFALADEDEEDFGVAALAAFPAAFLPVAPEEEDDDDEELEEDDDEDVEESPPLSTPPLPPPRPPLLLPNLESCFRSFDVSGERSRSLLRLPPPPPLYLL